MSIPKLSFSQNVGICLVLSFIQVFIIHRTQIIYIPELFTVIFSLCYGLLEPKRGWILAIIQIVIIIVSYLILDFFKIKAMKPDMAEFVSYISIFPSFAASFIGGMVMKM